MLRACCALAPFCGNDAARQRDWLSDARRLEEARLTDTEMIDLDMEQEA